MPSSDSCIFSTEGGGEYSSICLTEPVTDTWSRYANQSASGGRLGRLYSRPTRSKLKSRIRFMHEYCILSAKYTAGTMMGITVLAERMARIMQETCALPT